MTKLCIKIHMKSDSAIESAFPYYSNTYAFAGPGAAQKFSQIHRRHDDREDDHQDTHDLQTNKAHLKDETGKDDGSRRFTRRRDECLLRG